MHYNVAIMGHSVVIPLEELSEINSILIVAGSRLSKSIDCWRGCFQAIREKVNSKD